MVFLRIFRAARTYKVASMLIGFGASAVGVGTALGFSFVTARERKVDTSKFMAEPLTESQTLENSMDDIVFTFGVEHPGALRLHNYPIHLRNLTLPNHQQDGEVQKI